MKRIVQKLIIKLNNLGLIFIPDKQYLKIAYEYKIGKKLDIDNPKTLNEKLQWLKINDRKDLYTILVDKAAVKEYVSRIIGKQYIIPTIGIYDKFDDIDFESLPNQFVIKCTHDSGGVVICKDKKNFNVKKAKKKITKSLKRDYFRIGREWPYKNVKKKIIIEKFINNNNCDINDFKLQTFNGKVAYSFVCTDRFTGKVKYTFYDKNKKFIPVTQCGAPNDKKNAKLPNNYNKFVKLAEKLANNLQEVRVDFYDINGKIYFGELTFFDSSGFGKFEPDSYDRKFGDMWILEKETNEK